MKKAITEVRGMDTRELRGKLAELRKEQFDLRFRGAAETGGKTSRFKDVRRTIARISMVLAERAASDGAAAATPAPAKAAAKPASERKTAVKTAKSEKAAGKSAGGKKQ